MRDGVLLVDRAQKTEQALVVFFRAFAKNLLWRFLRVFPVKANRARRALESSQANLLHRHESNCANAGEQ